MMEYSQSGNVWVDVGLAVMCEMAGVDTIAELSVEHLPGIASSLDAIYTGNHPGWKSYLAMVFPNSAFQQARSYPATVRAHADRVLWAWQNDIDVQGRPCMFLPHLEGRIEADRSIVPLLNGGGMMNFSPNGGGFYVSGLALLAIHAMPFAGVKVGSRVLLIHELSDGEPRFMREVARRNMDMQLAWLDEKMEALLSVRSQIMNEIWQSEARLSSFTAYHFSNFGKVAGIDIFPVGMGIISQVITARHNPRWARLVGNAWDKGSNRIFERAMLGDYGLMAAGTRQEIIRSTGDDRVTWHDVEEILKYV